MLTEDVGGRSDGVLGAVNGGESVDSVGGQGELL